MMNFRVVTKALIDLLGNVAKERYRTIGINKRKSTSEVLKDSRTIQVFYVSGDFPPLGRHLVQHDILYQLQLIVSADTEIDLAVLEDPAATDNARSIALSKSRHAAEAIHEEMDEFLELIYQVLMDNRNIDIGLPAGTIANHWVPRMQKDPVPFPQGERICVSGVIALTLRVDESLDGDSGQLAEEIDIQVDGEDDDVERTGVTVNLEE